MRTAQNENRTGLKQLVPAILHLPTGASPTAWTQHRGRKQPLDTARSTLISQSYDRQFPAFRQSRPDFRPDLKQLHRPSCASESTRALRLPSPADAVAATGRPLASTFPARLPDAAILAASA